MYGPIEMTYKIVYMPASSANVYMIFILRVRADYDLLNTIFSKLSFLD